MQRRPQTTAILCSDCRAPVEFPGDGDLATCELCGARTQLEGWETGGESSPDRRTLDLDAGRALAVRTLDQDWLEAREKWVRRGPHGQAQVPVTAGLGRATGVLLILVYAAAAFAWVQAAGLGVLVAVIGTLVALARHWFETTRAGGYARARAAYGRRREAILDGSYPVGGSTPTANPAP